MYFLLGASEIRGPKNSSLSWLDVYCCYESINPHIIALMYELLIQIVRLLTRFTWGFFKYPVAMSYVSQFETKKGYAFVVDAYSKTNRVVSIPKSRFKITVMLDKELAHKAEKGKLIYGESVNVFDSEIVLKAHLEGRSFGNVRTSVELHSRPQRLFLLVRVKGPGSQNPSSRLQLARVYRTVKVKIVKKLFPFTYIEIPIRYIAIIAGNEKTRIMDS